MATTGDGSRKSGQGPENKGGPGRGPEPGAGSDPPVGPPTTTPATAGKQKARRPRRKKRFKVWRFLVLMVLVGGTVASGFGWYAYREFSRDLPATLSTLLDYRPSRASRVYDIHGELIGEFFLQRRVLVPFSRIPRHVQQAFVAGEDNRFYEHGGLDPIGIARAAYENFKAGAMRQGGSTITQQVAKLMLLSGEKKLVRKIREAILARRIEKDLSKDQILTIYLNHVYLGHAAYGVQAAAEAYYGKNVEDLTVAEAAILAGLPKAPSRDSPYVNFKRSKLRQGYVLDRMLELGFISKGVADAARHEPIALISRESPLSKVAAPYFVEHVRKYAQQTYGGKELFDRGLKIFTTLDASMQRAAEVAVRSNLEEIARKYSFRGPVGRVESPEARARWEKEPAKPFSSEELARLTKPPAVVDDEEAPEPPDAAVIASSPEARAAEAARQKQKAEAGKTKPVIEGDRVAQAPKPDATKGARVMDPKAPPPDQPVLGLVVALKPKAIVAVGNTRIPINDLDSSRVRNWSSRANDKVLGAREKRAAASKAAASKVKGEKAKPRKIAHVEVGDVLAVRVVDKPPKIVRKGKKTEKIPQKEVVLAHQPDLQAALVAVEPKTGHLKAMVGGYDYFQSQFNRATQARRQIGSAVKPFIYSAALDRGVVNVLSIVHDKPVSFQTSSGTWSPHNYKNEFLGAVTLKTALAKSLNTVAAQLLAQIGVDNEIEWMRTLGLTSPIPRSMSICLGAIDVSPMEVAYAESTFPNGGLDVPQLFVLKVVDADGEVLEDHTRPPPPKRKIGAETAYLMVDLMKGVVQFGTGKAAQALGRPAAGKTGTSQSFRDNWFVGYTPDLFAVVWVGRDNFMPIGPNSTGGSTALPFWLDFMRAAHPPTPIRDFAAPPGILFVRASHVTGKPASPSDGSSILAPFKRGTLPATFASAKGKKGESSMGTDEVF